MAIPNSAWTEVLTAALHARKKQVVHNILNHDPFLAYLRASGQVQPADGGVSLVEHLSYPGNDTFQRYSGYETLSTAATDVLTSAEFAWKQAAIAIAASGLELRQTSGKAQIVDFWRSKITNAEQAFANNIADDCFSAGTASGGKQIGGLQYLVEDVPTSSTIGGISRSTQTWWRNKVYDISVSGSGAASAANIQGYMNNLEMLVAAEGKNRGDLWVLDSTYYQFYWNSLQAIQRISSEREAASGFEMLTYYGPTGRRKVMYDSSCPSEHGYSLNTKHLRFRPHTAANFEMSGKKEAINQDAVVAHLILMANMVTNAPRFQGVLHA